MSGLFLLERVFIDILHGDAGVDGDIDGVGDDICQSVYDSIHFLGGDEHIARIGAKDIGDHLIFFLLLQRLQGLIEGSAFFRLLHHFP